jgi:hypothetical protein
MARTDITAAVNSRLTPIVDYGIDPRGLRLFRAITSVARRGIDGTDGTVVTRRSPEWNGYAAPPQQFTGVAPLGNARPTVQAVSMLSDERAGGTLTDAALATYAQRLARGRR